MTTPTQAQVETVAVLIARVFYRPAPDMSGDIWKSLNAGSKHKCVRVATDILNELPEVLAAAAEVETMAKLDDPLERAVTRAAHQREIKEAIAATIERCAQVAETFFNTGDMYPSRKIAAAIRALKDK